METNITRYPRPKGLTNISKRYNDNPTKANRGKLNKTILTHYLSQSLLYPYPLEKPILNQYKDETHQSLKPNKKQRKISINIEASNPHNSLSQQNKQNKLKLKNPSHNPTLYQLRIMEYKELCKALNYSDQKVQKLIAKYLSHQAESYMDKQGIKEIFQDTRGTIFSNFFGALREAHSHTGWVEELKTASREAFYKPSMVKEANSAISTQQTILMNINQLAQSLIKTLNPNPNEAPNPTNIQNNFYGTQLPEEGSKPLDESGYLLSPTKALQLMEAKGLLSLPTETEFKALHEEYITPDVPSTQALPSDAQGIQRKELVLVADKELKHEERREEGLDSLNDLSHDEA